MARKQLPRTKPPAIQHGNPGSSEPFSRALGEGAVGRGFRPSSPHHHPSSGVSRSREEKKRGRGRGLPAGNLAALRRPESETPFGLRGRDPTREKECAECSGGRQGRSAAKGRPDPTRLRLPQLTGCREPRPSPARRCGCSTVLPDTVTALGPFSVCDFQV